MHLLLTLTSAALLAGAQRPESACYSFSGSYAFNKSTAFTACTAFQDARNSCNDGDPPPSIFLPCICNQEFLNSIYEYVVAERCL